MPLLYFLFQACMWAGGLACLLALWVMLTNNEIQHRYFKPYRRLPCTVPVMAAPAKGAFTVRDFFHVKAQGGEQDSSGAKEQTQSQVRQGHRQWRSCVAHSETGRGSVPSTLRIMTWNIERGFQFSRVLRHLMRLRPEIILLQEVDHGCLRSGSLDVGAELAKRLGMHIMFVTHQVVNGGHHGDAILSIFPLEKAWVTRMPSVRSASLHTGTKYYGVVSARVKIPQVGSVDLYSVHTDAYTGIRGRVRQLNAVMKDYRKENGGRRPCIIAGDLNTMGDGYKRLLPFFCNDDLRWGSLGLTEEEWWRRNFWNRTAFQDTDRTPTLKLLGGWLMADKLDWLLAAGLDKVGAAQVAGSDASDHSFVCADFAVPGGRTEAPQ